MGCVVGRGVLVSNDRPEEGLGRTCVGMTGGAGVEGIDTGGIGTAVFCWFANVAIRR